MREYSKEGSFNLLERQSREDEKIEDEIEEEIIPQVVKQEVRQVDPSQLVNPFHIGLFNDSIIKKNSKLLYNNFSCRVAFSQNGNFISMGKFNKDSFKYQINVNKVVPNASLIKPLMEKDNEKEGSDILSNVNSSFKYPKLQNTSVRNVKKREEETPQKEEKFYFSSLYYFHSFIKLLDKINSKVVTHCRINSEGDKKSKISDLDVPEFSKILREYISLLENSKLISEEDDQNFSFDNSLRKPRMERIQPIYKEKIESEINTLKLFEGLFLNPFFSKNRNYQARQVNSLSEDCKRMRKKKILEWLIKDSNDSYNTDIKTILREKTDNNLVDTNYKEIHINLVSGKVKNIYYS
jgi:hypothetical protein